MEKVYIAPVFCKYCSYADSYDSIEIEQDQIYFLIAEYAARRARMEMDSLCLDIPNSTGVLSIWFSTITSTMLEIQYEMNAAYTQDLMVERLPDAFNKWLKLMQ